jgi:hypothetical protein
VRKLFNDKFICSQTKCTAIFTNVIAPFAKNRLDVIEKVTAISAGNTNRNFGGKKRKGKNNLYYVYKLPDRTSNNLTGIGGAAHRLSVFSQ